MISPEFRLRARTFGIGAACGFLAGAALVGLIVSRYGPATSTARGPAAPPAVQTDDGMAGVDGPREPEGTRPATAPGPPAASPSGGRDSAGTSADPTSTIVPPSADELTERGLTIPVEGITREQLVESFAEPRGTRVHEAIDILAPRNTPVKAVDDGTIAKLFESKAGGITIYQFDPAGRFCYYYAHLERYAEGVREGDRVRKGQVLGYVGTSGNAAKDTPHLHFAVFQLTAAKRWWEGTPINPYPVLR